MSELIDRQAAIVEIAKKEKILPYYSNGERPSEAFFNAGLHAAMGIIQSQPTASPWHSMEDNGPPEEKGPYFVYAPSYIGGSSSAKERARGVMISKWTGKHWSIEVGYYERPGCVTHWMPIEPPKEDA